MRLRWRDALDSISKRNRLRRRDERRVLNDCQRWTILGKLRTGQALTNDGVSLLKSHRYDLYYCRFRGRNDATMVHPKWLSKR